MESNIINKQLERGCELWHTKRKEAKQVKALEK